MRSLCEARDLAVRLLRVKRSDGLRELALAFIAQSPIDFCDSAHSVSTTRGSFFIRRDSTAQPHDAYCNRLTEQYIRRLRKTVRVKKMLNIAKGTAALSYMILQVQLQALVRRRHLNIALQPFAACVVFDARHRPVIM